MTVEAIRLKNFMPFVDTGWIEFRPITLLFGRNSSGKSAIIRALRLLKQSVDSEQPLQFSAVDEGDVDLGSYECTVHGNVTERQIGFAFRCRVPVIVDPLREQLNALREDKISAEDASTVMELHLAYGWSESNKQVEIREVEVIWTPTEEEDDVLFTATKFSWEDTEAFEYEWQIVSDYEEVIEMNWSLATVQTTRGFLPKLVGFSEYNLNLNYTMSALLDDLAVSISDYFASLAHLGPLRPEPRRVYFLDSQERRRWRQQGWQAFLDLLDNALSGTDIEQINQGLQHLRLGFKVADQLQSYSDEDVTVTRLRVFKEESDVAKQAATNIVDLGSGIAQSLPILCHIASSFIAASLSAIEQPELHLHPMAQARLADLFIDAVKNNAFFLIESHSEHLMLRFRRRIAETTLGLLDPTSHDDNSNLRYQLGQNKFNLIYVEWNEIGSSLESVEVDHRGQLINPSKNFRNFFDDDYDEVLHLTKAKNAILGIEYDSEDNS